MQISRSHGARGIPNIKIDLKKRNPSFPKQFLKPNSNKHTARVTKHKIELKIK
jgi:hypothetical protein